MDGGFVTPPAVGFWNPTTGAWEVENFGVAPDIEVDLDPHAVRAGHDPQLEKAVEFLLEELKKNPPMQHQKPAFPELSQGRSAADYAVEVSTSKCNDDCVTSLLESLSLSPTALMPLLPELDRIASQNYKHLAPPEPVSASESRVGSGGARSLQGTSSDHAPRSATQCYRAEVRVVFHRQVC